MKTAPKIALKDPPHLDAIISFRLINSTATHKSK